MSEQFHPDDDQAVIANPSRWENLTKVAPDFLRFDADQEPFAEPEDTVGVWRRRVSWTSYEDSADAAITPATPVERYLAVYYDESFDSARLWDVSSLDDLRRIAEEYAEQGLWRLHSLYDLDLGEGIPFRFRAELDWRPRWTIDDD